MNTDNAVANSFTDDFATALVNWMSNHTKPSATEDSSDENNVAVQSGPPSSDSDNDASFGDVAIIDTSTALDGRSFEA